MKAPKSKKQQENYKSTSKTKRVKFVAKKNKETDKKNKKREQLLENKQKNKQKGFGKEVGRVRCSQSPSFFFFVLLI